MRPMGKAKPGFEKRFVEIFNILESGTIPELTSSEKLRGMKKPSQDDLLKEWFENQISTYETLKAPRVGYDEIANEWLDKKRLELDENISKEQFIEENKGYYVLELAPEKDGVPVYISLGQDENVFRGQFLYECEDILGPDLVGEAWQTKLAEDTLDFGRRLMSKGEKIANQHNLQYLKNQRMPPEDSEDSIVQKVHIIFSLAKWLIFYGENGHGYQADY